MFAIENLKFDKNGLIPAVVQDYYSGKVLMVAYMNAESLSITLEEKRTCFWSRSRNELWRKGETSGNRQNVISVTTDCDADTLLIEVTKEGPACHTGSESCFFEDIYSDGETRNFSLSALFSLLLDRKLNPREKSYTNYLFDSGAEKILKKIGEECSEVIISAMKGSREETVYEIADLCYHTLVLMAERGISPSDILEELASRHVKDDKRETV
ncbi:MAG: bifunctional phosphoribosyl-AMP cyclohydrolase/phosphoribosyl-ATP diphosphatase HisIE [Oscillospiraceae bacterium]|nr:bifunctional phosphoribosyl-AMP cyclohydrolase/phosphoribosyl-ATP diphosphatase HisIE [Oscillospiraceae bacterium]